MATRTIEMFRPEEAASVATLLGEHGIEFETNVVHLGADIMGGRHAHTFEVPEERFDEAIALLKKAFNIRPDVEELTGDCPACGAALHGWTRCPECDLNLSSDYSALTKAHPFVRFLQRNGLLDEPEPDPVESPTTESRSGTGTGLLLVSIALLIGGMSLEGTTGLALIALAILGFVVTLFLRLGG